MTHSGTDGRTPPDGAAPVPGGGSRPRLFGPTNLAVANRTSIAALVAILTILGLISYRSIPKEASPEVTVPMV